MRTMRMKKLQRHEKTEERGDEEKEQLKEEEVEG